MPDPVSVAKRVPMPDASLYLLLSEPLLLQVLIITAATMVGWGIARVVVRSHSDRLTPQAREVLASWGVPLSVALVVMIAGSACLGCISPAWSSGALPPSC